jgi:hypothetical protein
VSDPGHPERPVTFEGNSPSSAEEWFQAIMRAHAGVSGELAWGQFFLGQLGALSQTGSPDVERLIEQIETDLTDLDKAVELYQRTARDVLANVRRNLGKS